MQEESRTTSFSLLRPIAPSNLLNLAGGVVNFGINSSTKVIKGSLHLVDRSVGTSVNLTKSAIGLVRNSVNVGCDLAVGVVDVGKNLTSGVIKVIWLIPRSDRTIRNLEISSKTCNNTLLQLKSNSSSNHITNPT